ncbi:hypothetical protein PHMEG_0001753 [Phytophthora megakarya]|uniref:Transmembrane protein n=1 Tax=Phytophthora megakarya TaxID=4795 RepID=A0A225X0X0_9STRA|nr:hypothetical protein PHMEG_0001753 [Phytophthora megakarya]
MNHRTPEYCGSCLRSILAFGKRVLHRWLELQVSHRGGKYSVERLLALEQYSRNSSLARVLFVCFCTPLPTVFIILGQELVPLQNPKDGSYANYGFWFRIGFVTGVVAYATAAQSYFLVDRVTISQRQLLLIGLFVGTTFPAITMVSVSTLVFPVPFIVVSGLPLFFVLWITSICATVGIHFVQDITVSWDEFFQYVKFVCTETLMVVVYPAYQTLFTTVINTRYELPVILMLPLIKMVMKNLLWINKPHVQDLMPEAVIFTADFFNAFYLATCMQRVSSLSTICIIMTIDLSQNVIALYCLHKHTKDTSAYIRGVPGVDESNLLKLIRSLCHDPNFSTKQIHSGINLRSCLQYPLSSASQDFVDRMETILTDRGTSAKHNTSCSTRSKILPFKEILTVHTAINSVGVNRSPTDQMIKPKVIGKTHSGIPSIIPHHTDRSHILSDTLETLFTSECHVLTEYLEALIPMLYGCFVLAMVRLPNAQYHIDLNDITIENVNPTVKSVFIYGILEIVSFVVHVAVMQRNCGMNSLYQLAFVLETQIVLVQGNLMSWALITLAFRVIHFGTNV